MNKIIIDTAALKALLDLHPEVEVELLAVAREKVAEELKRKLPPDHAQKTVDKLVADIERRLNDRVLGYSSRMLSDTSRSLIREFVYEVLNAQTKATAEKTAQDIAEKAFAAMLPRLEERLVQHQDALLRKINGFVGEEISRQVSARLDAMTKLTAGLGD